MAATSALWCAVPNSCAKGRNGLAATRFGIDLHPGRDRRKAAVGIAADLKVRKTGLEVLGGHVVKVIELLGRAAPHLLPTHLGLVPDLLISDGVVKSVCPSFGVVADDVLADACPFGGILRRMGAVGLDVRLILNGNAQAVVGLDIRLDQRRDQVVGKGEIVICEIVFIRIPSRPPLLPDKPKFERIKPFDTPNLNPS